MQSDYPIDSLEDEALLEHGNFYILRQLEIRSKLSATSGPPLPGPAITISHQTAAGEHEIAKRLSAILQSTQPKGTAPWTVFDRQLVEQVLEKYQLFQSLKNLTPGNRLSALKSVLEKLLGPHPSSWMVLPQVAEAVIHLADAGYVILIGHGASFITGRLSNVFHVRLVAASPDRIVRLQSLNHLSLKQAARFVAEADQWRGRHAKKHFHTRVDDDLQYHLVINTSRIACGDAAALIADGARQAFGTALTTELGG